jgi:hypothetical protein
MSHAITRSQTSLVLSNDPQTLRTLKRLLSQFSNNLENGGGWAYYIAPIQEARQAQLIIGGGNIIHALMILTATLFSEHYDTIMGEGHGHYSTDYLANVQRSVEGCVWATEYVICSKILSKYPNLETLNDIANDNTRLLLEITAALDSYEVMYTAG